MHLVLTSVSARLREGTLLLSLKKPGFIVAHYVHADPAKTNLSVKISRILERHMTALLSERQKRARDRSGSPKKEPISTSVLSECLGIVMSLDNREDMKVLFELFRSLLRLPRAKRPTLTIVVDTFSTSHTRLTETLGYAS